MAEGKEAASDAWADLWTRLGRIGGVALERYRPDVLRRRLESWMARRGFREPSELLAFLAARPDGAADLIAYLTVNFSEFFRQRGLFEYLREHVLRPWPRGRPFRALSLGCSRGQEAYSVAIVCHQTWRSSVSWYVVGLDIDGPDLRQAVRGVYGVRELRSLQDAERAEFLEAVDPSGERYRVRRDVARRVGFVQGDAFRLPVRSESADLVLLRNLLIFIQPRYHDTILAEAWRVLRPGGRLVLGSVERVPPGWEAAWVAEAPVWHVFQKRGGEEWKRS